MLSNGSIKEIIEMEQAMADINWDDNRGIWERAQPYTGEGSGQYCYYCGEKKYGIIDRKTVCRYHYSLQAYNNAMGVV